MKVLVTGVTGQLGHDVVKTLTERGIDCKGVSSKDFDLADPIAVKEYITKAAPKVVIHCSAYTAVDRAEDDAEKCKAVNVAGTRAIAEAVKELDAKMVYISTDYVFPGTGDQFYKEEDPTGPHSVYGKTKLLGEQEVSRLLEKQFIVRISWVFGSNGNNFVKTMLRLGKEKESLTVVADQIGSPTYTADLSEFLCDLIETDKYGIYHASNEGVCSWAEFAEEIMRQAGLSCKIVPIPTSEYKSRAQRPLNSRMSKEKLKQAGFAPLPEWQDALKRYLLELQIKEDVL